GTQHSFEAERDVLYISSHQYPYYPGTGAATEVGVGRGAGATLNIPMVAGCGDAEYAGVFQRLVAPAARSFAPDVILVSAGFDPHADDPLAGMRMSAKGFEILADTARRLADELCGGRIVFSLEGGYAASGLADGTRAVLRTALADEVPTHAAPAAPPGSTLAGLIDSVCEVHSGRIPDLGAV
ncbi:MAG: histone deacetylase, partial [Myxococcales bacterium]|nr:histone deacetylase [Myxococcales bacterium]